MDCLVKKLKGSVQNADLERLGTIVLTLDSSVSYSDYFAFSGASEGYIEGSGYFTDSTGSENQGRRKESASGITVRIKSAADGDKLFIKSKYSITNLETSESSTLRQLKEGSRVNLDGCVSLTRIKMSRYNENVYFDFNSFSKYNCVITSFRWHYNPYITGDIETIVENMIAGGRTFGTTLTIDARSCKIKLNDIAFIKSNASTVTITFTSASNVTVVQDETTLATYDGSTWTYNS